MPHIVKKQLISLTIDASLDGFHIQEMVSRHYWSAVVPMLEKAFDSLGGGDEVVTIDRLEVDLGIFLEKNIRQENWTATLPAKLEEVLTRLLRSGRHDTKVTINAPQTNVFDQWVYYMERGYRPWNATGKMADDDIAVLETLAIDFGRVHQLRRLLLAEPRVLARIVALHPASFLLQLVEVILAGKQEALPAAVDEGIIILQYIASRRKEAGPGEPELRRTLWMEALRQAALIAEERRTSGLLPQLLPAILKGQLADLSIPRRIRVKLPVTGEWVQKAAKAEKQAREEQQKLAQREVDKLEKESRPKKDRSGTDNGPIGSNKQPKPGSIHPPNQPKDRESDLPPSALKPPDPVLTEEGIFVVNAGIVLLHPFLTTLFDRLGWLENKQFKTPQYRERALYGLHYLVTGLQQAEEAELVMPKVLCAYPIEQPVNPDIQLTNEEIAEADDLLTAAIQRWEILKNSSHTALREGFLQRPGKLSQKNGSWYLQVERMSYDMLLDYLPWNLSMILLPWMKDIFRVEWR
ncbi:MAG: hypothetical protein BGO55_03595 [Sphingobacteriales bacterium 50-39]|nr:hypothetical protein [Sphingobacteriales bacterium]OJW55633.1 MAG: hypothetical protein BGO55_03595 [Sphingobacteriales bacterium 50-39]